MKIDEREKYWFPAKRFGWGWGPPSAWQGWAVLAGYVAAVAFVGVLFSPARHPTLFGVGILVLTGSLVFICFVKGEPPAWRWNGKKSGGLP